MPISDPSTTRRPLPAPPRHPARLRHGLVAALLTGLLVSGCGSIRTSVTRDLMKDVSFAAQAHEDLDLVSIALPTYLLFLDGVLAGDPDNEEMLLAAAEGYTAYATLVEATEPARVPLITERARRYGLRALTHHRRAVAGRLTGSFADFDGIEAELRRGDVPYVFWAASAWGSWIAANTSSMAALADLPRVITLMEWVVAQDEGYRNGAAHIFLGVVHAARPPMLGGDLEASRRHFERALELTERRDLMVHVQMARFYARQSFDRELYIELLDEALSTPIDTAPELTLQNAAARRLAAHLKEKTDEYF
jgi:hypothetical protein